MTIIYFIQICAWLLLMIDRIFLPKQARRGWYAMCAVNVVLTLWLHFGSKEHSSGDTVGTFLSTDVLLFALGCILFREMFIARARHIVVASQVTKLVRSIAINNCEVVMSANDSQISPKNNATN